MGERLSQAFDFDAYKPAQIALRVEAAGVAKARLDFVTTLMLSVLAGAYISFGALFFTIAVTGSELGWGPTQLLGGIAFSLGLVLVIVAGAELFTGNALIVMAWADGKIRGRELLRNWVIVYIGNFIGSTATGVLVVLSGVLDLNGGAVGGTAASIASTKLELGLVEAFFRGILCNVLVCLAVWLSFAGRSVIDKVAAIVFPITAFVGAGFEHSVANMYVIPVAMLAGLRPGRRPVRTSGEAVETGVTRAPQISRPQGVVAACLASSRFRSFPTSLARWSMNALMRAVRRKSSCTRSHRSVVSSAIGSPWRRRFG
jgi:formate transporter